MALLKKPDYPTRLFLWLLAYSIVLVGSFITFQYHREKKFKTEELNLTLQILNNEILEQIHDRGPIHIPAHPFRDLRLTLIDSCGNVIYDNTIPATNGKARTNHADRTEILMARLHGTAYTVRRQSETTGEAYFYSATSGENGTVIRTAVPYSLSLQELLHADMGFLWIMGAIALVMCVLGFLFTRKLGQHILRLNNFAERAERGERIYDTAPFPPDELGSISNHIVRLYANLQTAIAERQREHSAAMFEQREKERIKKQLTNNINHELKTPVASIQLCLETLLQHPDIQPEKRVEFLQRCMANTERLTRLLEDVSLITRMDEAPATISKSAVDLRRIIEEVADEFRLFATAKGFDIHLCINQRLIMTGNVLLLASVFRNLFANAISYSGGSEISVNAITSDTGVVITVADDGTGIDSRHLPLIFERFYRIDKGRSRAAGGTGLGLSIVKNAIQLHGGAIEAKNRASGGLVFTITMPLADPGTAPDSAS